MPGVGGVALKGKSGCVARQPGDREDSSDAGWLLLVGGDIMPLSPPWDSSLQNVWRVLCRLKLWPSSSEKKQGIVCKKCQACKNTHWGNWCSANEETTGVQEIALEYISDLKYSGQHPSHDPWKKCWNTVCCLSWPLRGEASHMLTIVTCCRITIIIVSWAVSIF